MIPESWYSVLVGWIILKDGIARKINYVDIAQYCEFLNKSAPSKLMIFVKLLLWEAFQNLP